MGKQIDQMPPPTSEELTAAHVEQVLRFLGGEEKARHLMRFFKTGKGEYGEGDLFLGVVVPDSRKVARAFRLMPLPEVRLLLLSPYHECRLVALLILIEQYKKAGAPARQALVDFYLLHTHRINNWDLVDVSVCPLLGAHLMEGDRSLLYRLAESSMLWEQRISIVTTLAFVRKGDLDDALQLAEKLLYHEHDLMRKAVGWVLREVGKKDRSRLCAFLDRYADSMPRTSLRYAIEHFEEGQRQYYMRLGK